MHSGGFWSPVENFPFTEEKENSWFLISWVSASESTLCSVRIEVMGKADFFPGIQSKHLSWCLMKNTKERKRVGSTEAFIWG